MMMWMMILASNFLPPSVSLPPLRANFLPVLGFKAGGVVTWLSLSLFMDLWRGVHFLCGIKTRAHELFISPWLLSLSLSWTWAVHYLILHFCSHDHHDDDELSFGLAWLHFVSMG